MGSSSCYTEFSMPRKHLLTITALVTIAVIFAIVGMNIGTVFAPSGEPAQEQSELSPSLQKKLESGFEGSGEPATEVTLEGRVVSSGDLETPIFQLVSDSGEILAELKSSNIDLNFVAGSKVTIEGLTTNADTKGVMLVTVTSIGF